MNELNQNKLEAQKWNKLSCWNEVGDREGLLSCKTRRWRYIYKGPLEKG